MYETSTCSYVFQWVTSFACPVVATSGTNCTVTLPATNETFDLWPLSTSDQALKSPPYTYYINVCHAVSQVNCNVAPGSGACQVKSNSTAQFSLGIVNSGITYSDGVFKIRYTNGTRCSSGVGRITEIIFECDPDAGIGSPTFTGEISTCVYQFSWQTSQVCSQIKPVECMAVDPVNNNTYDLSSLSLSDRNWLATNTL